MRPRRPIPPAALLLALGAVALAATLACGKPATEAECTEIVARIAELEAKGMPSADPAEVARQVAEAKAEFSALAKRECVGKRIRSDALACVRKATSAKEIVSRCLD